MTTPIQLQDPNEDKILTLAHKLADLSLRPLREVRQEIERLAGEIQALAGENTK